MAIDNGINNGQPTDQRGPGYPRTNDDPAVDNPIDGDGTDSGAFEVHLDTDGVLDENDALPLDSAEWSDNDGDGAGDNGDADDHNDGAVDTADNCSRTPNPNQADLDLDGIGDVCDPLTGPPVNAMQCKHGGWARFNVPRMFTSQTDCQKWLKQNGGQFDGQTTERNAQSHFLVKWL